MQDKFDDHKSFVIFEPSNFMLAARRLFLTFISTLGKPIGLILFISFLAYFGFLFLHQTNPGFKEPTADLWRWVANNIMGKPNNSREGTSDPTPPKQGQTSIPEPPPPIPVPIPVPSPSLCSFPDGAFPLTDTMVACIGTAGCVGVEQICRQIAKSKGIALSAGMDCVATVASRLDFFDGNRVASTIVASCPVEAYRFIPFRDRRENFIADRCAHDPKFVATLKLANVPDLPFDTCPKRN